MLLSNAMKAFESGLTYYKMLQLKTNLTLKFILQKRPAAQLKDGENMGKLSN